MNLPAFCIKRPAFTIVLSLVMTIIGVIGFLNLPLRWIPNVNPPQVSISTDYPGASAKLVEHDVTKVIEGGLSGINGIETISSSSGRDYSYVTLTFKLGTNMNIAVEEVRSAVEKVRGLLPKEVLNPTVMKADPNSEALMYIAFYDNKRTAMQLSDYIDKNIVPLFETIDGVGNVSMFGKRISAVKVNVDPEKMAGANVTVDEVANLLHEQSTQVPSGQIRGLDRYYSLVTDTSLKTIQQFNDLIIRSDKNETIRLRDIGAASIDAEEKDSEFRISGKSAVALGIVPQSTANPLEVEQNIQKVFKTLQGSLPPSMHASIAFNSADYIRASIHSVYEAFFEAIFCVWLVIFIFICNFRATLIPIVTIPVCVISTFAVLHFFGFTINTITLMAFVLAIGLVVDDAIVMLENISRHIETGMSTFAASLQGSKEIIFPIIAMTLTLVAVYAPIALTPGLLGILFREFTITLAAAVIISGVIALTLSPMMCARLLRVSQPSWYALWFQVQMQRLQGMYVNVLHYLLGKRLWVIGSLVLVAVMGFFVHRYVPSELAPAEDMNQIFAAMQSPRSASFQYTNQYLHQLEDIFKKYPEIKQYISFNFSPNYAFNILKLVPKGERSRSTDALIAALSKEVNTLPGVRVNVFTPPPALARFASGREGASLGIALRTSSDYMKLQQASQKMLDEIRKNPGFLYADNSLKWNTEQFQLSLDREKAADLHVPVANITNTISTLVAGRQIGKTDDANIILQMQESSLSNPNVISQLYVRNTVGSMVPLSNMLSLTETTSPEMFHHEDRLRADNIHLTLAPDFKLAKAINTLKQIAQENLPDDIKYTFTGQAKSFLDSQGKTVFTFALALIFIYLVLVAQFESFIDPLIIMFTVPFAMVGAIITLKIFNGTMNIYSNIGLITLVGLIAKHGILITEFANQKRAQGKSIRLAVVESALMRLRPILMTTAAMVLGALPLAFAFGPGAESRQQIGLVIVGGLLFGTFFSLIVVPIAYTYLAPLRKIEVIQGEAR